MIKHNYLNNVPLDRALELFISELKEAGLNYKTELVASANSHGRISAKAVYAKTSSPHYNAAAMDGIALDASKTYGASATAPLKLSKDDFAVVDTGDKMPPSADCVIMAEDLIRGDDEESFTIISAAVPWQHVRQIGEDICAGDMLMPSFTKITPALAGALLAGGVLDLEVIKTPLVGIIPTGDEIVSPRENPKPGEIVEFNSVILSGMLDEWGAKAKTYPIVQDRLGLIEKAIQKSAEECDFVLMIAGSSAGREDYTAKALENTGKLLLHGLAIKPGKPAVLGRLGQVPFVGVPGYPVSAILVMEKLVKEALSLLTKENYVRFPQLKALAGHKISSSLKNREFLRTTVSFAASKPVALPLSSGAGVITSMTKAAAIIDIDQNTEGFEAGEEMELQLLHPLEKLKNTLVVTGSHDPLIDEIFDLFRLNEVGFDLSSSHTGSMGGITAVKSGHAHTGGIHLLDTQSGEYNLSYIKKYFPQGGVVLIEGVRRTQGIITAAGNPKNIKAFADIADLSYVNRQRGSGTRILCDYLALQAGLETEKIYGYGREEYTHTGVAALIAAGSADAGLGIYSAAKLYGLDFISVAEEYYDFICLKENLEDEKMQAFLAVLKSSQFRQRLENMGGYGFQNPAGIKAVF